MTGVLFRTGSGPIHASLLSGSPKVSLPIRHDSFSSSDKQAFSPLVHNSRPRISRSTSERRGILRLRSSSTGSQTFPEMLPEVVEDLFYDDVDVIGGIGTLKFAEKSFDRISWAPASGGNGSDRNGFGSRRNNDKNNNNNNNNDNIGQKKLGTNYIKMLKSNPNDPLLPRNYGKFLHEVEGDVVKAEEYYGKAILASPGDGELLSLYGKLIWDTKRDGERAQSYFDQAVSVSSDDCMVMGLYAQFMWESEEDEDENNKDEYRTPFGWILFWIFSISISSCMDG